MHRHRHSDTWLQRHGHRHRDRETLAPCTNSGTLHVTLPLSLWLSLADSRSRCVTHLHSFFYGFARVLRREEFLENLHIRNDYRYDVGFKAVAIHPHLRVHVGV